jgi:hypothetical protein
MLTMMRNYNSTMDSTAQFPSRMHPSSKYSSVSFNKSPHLTPKKLNKSARKTKNLNILSRPKIKQFPRSKNSSPFSKLQMHYDPTSISLVGHRASSGFLEIIEGPPRPQKPHRSKLSFKSDDLPMMYKHINQHQR